MRPGKLTETGHALWSDYQIGEGGEFYLRMDPLYLMMLPLDEIIECQQAKNLIQLQGTRKESRQVRVRRQEKRDQRGRTGQETIS